MNQHDIGHHTIGSTGILIDGFKFASPNTKGYFLTHFHSDHYGGLDERFPWDNDHDAKLYCSPVTAGLVAHALEVRGRHIQVIPFDCPTRVLDFTVTLVPANHCPGAAMLLFQLQNGRTVLHTGDMRYSPSMLQNPHLRQAAGIDQRAPDSSAKPAISNAATGSISGVKRSRDDRASSKCFIDEVYLDTTYSRPKHAFPPQSESVDRIVAIVKGLMPEGTVEESAVSAPVDAPTASGETLLFPSTLAAASTSSAVATAAVTAAEPLFHDIPANRTDKALILVSTYVVGKERILIALARRLKLRVFVSLRKLLLLQHLGLNADDLAYFTPIRTDADIHVVGMGMCGRSFPYFQSGFSNMERYLSATNAAVAAKKEAGATAAAAVTGVAAGAASDEAEDAAFLNGETPATAAIGEPSGYYKRIVGIVPTGWVFNNKKSMFQKDNVTVYLVPYSEHSSFPELVEMVKFLRPRKIIPTVYADQKDQHRIEALFSQLIDQTEAKKAFFGQFKLTSSATTAAAPAPAPVPTPVVLTDDDQAVNIADDDTDDNDASDDDVICVENIAPKQRCSPGGDVPAASAAALHCFACLKTASIGAGGKLQCPSCKSMFVELRHPQSQQLQSPARPSAAATLKTYFTASPDCKH
jgi:DNA ligase-1